MDKTDYKATYLKEKEQRKQRDEAYKAMEKQEKASSKLVHAYEGDSYLSCQHLNKIYSNRVQAVFDFNLEVKEGEFVILVGPSGCGKSTTLRMIAGLEDITGGDLYIDGKYANKLDPKQRGVAMVFQSYALYPHLSVYENMAFGLRGSKGMYPSYIVSQEKEEEIKARYLEEITALKQELKEAKKEDKNALRLAIKQKKRERDVELFLSLQKEKDPSGNPILKQRRINSLEINFEVMKAAKSLQITPYLDRKPTALSGGQCQRVALGRAMVRNAKIFLLDEPLSNLDAKLRVAMRSELVRLHDELGMTILYVTHDQTEAMTMADRIVIMKDGLIQQIGTPLDVYQRPENVFVATFIGSPTMNIRKARLERQELCLGEARYELSKEEIEALDRFYLEKKDSLETIQKEQLKAEDLARIESELARVNEYLDKKSTEVCFGIRPEDILLEKGEDPCYKPFKATCEVVELLGAEYFLHYSFLGKDMVAKVANRESILAGQEVELRYKKKGIHLFDAVTEERIF